MSLSALAQVSMTGAAPCHVFIPSQVKRPPLVLVHGLSTRPERLIQYACLQAAQHGIPLLVPDFSGPDFKGYQSLKSGPSSAHGAAQALIASVRETVEHYDWPSYQFDLMGFSAGAQFAHRFALYYGQHLCSLTVASPGWYTYLDHSLAYPLGLKSEGTEPAPTDLKPDLTRFLNLPIMIAVGEDDQRRDKQLRTSPQVDLHQGRNRLERAQAWHQHLKVEAKNQSVTGRYEFVTLPKTGHSIGQAVKAGGLMEHLFRFVLASSPDPLTPDTLPQSRPASLLDSAGVPAHSLTESLS